MDHSPATAEIIQLRARPRVYARAEHPISRKQIADSALKVLYRLNKAEIIAKKMWHRGDRAKARDLFDLCAVATGEPEQLRAARPSLARQGAAFLRALAEREDVLRREFAEIDVMGDTMHFDECLQLAESIIKPRLRTGRRRR